MAQLIKPNGQRKELALPITLEDAQKMVGGYVEVVHPKKMPTVIMLVNEDGLDKGLPPNLVASQFYGGVIVGNAIIIPRDQMKAAGWGPDA